MTTPNPVASPRRRCVFLTNVLSKIGTFGRPRIFFEILRIDNITYHPLDTCETVPFSIRWVGTSVRQSSFHTVG